MSGEARELEPAKTPVERIADALESIARSLAAEPSQPRRKRPIIDDLARRRAEQVLRKHGL